MVERTTAKRKNSGLQRPVIRRVAEGVVLIALIYGLHLYRTWDVSRGTAPDFDSRLLDGTPVSLSEFRGRPLLLQFWATWCPVCNMEQRSIDRIAQDHAVLSVALDEASSGQMLQWMDEKGVSYAVILDPSGRISRQFGVNGVPTSLIIDAGGEIRFVEVGYTTEMGLRLRIWWAGL